MIFDHPDEIGSATTATDCAGNVVQERLYYPFGEFWKWFGGTPSAGMHPVFAQLPDYDPETDQYNTANRHYSPSGRWMSPDPGGIKSVKLDDPQTWNMYAYVRNNPTSLTDPTGLADCPVMYKQSASCNELGEAEADHAAEMSVATDAVTTATAAQNQNADTPAPTNPDGTPKPPPNPPPPGKDGKPNEWVRVPGTKNRPDKWVPRDPVPSPKGGQPGASWDPEGGHWDVDDGNRNRTRYLPDGTIVDHNNNPIPMTSMWDSVKNLLPGAVVSAGTAAIVTYIIVSEGSRILFPPRNLVPVP
jgi:RHS repeat-associated protein